MDARAEQIRSLYRQGLSQREIGRRLGISQVAVQKRLARQRLLPAMPGESPASPDNRSDNHDHGERDNQAAITTPSSDNRQEPRSDNHLPGRCEKCGRKIPPRPQPWACCGGCIVDGTHLWFCDEANGVEVTPAGVSSKRQGKQGL